VRVTRVLAVLLLLLAAVAAPAAGGSSRAHATAINPLGVTVVLDRTAVSTTIGQRFQFNATVRNETGAPLTGLIAHLNILSTDPATYVDPEDWSSERTRYLAELPGHGSVRVQWRARAVNSGRFVLYVAVTSKGGRADIAASEGLRLLAADQRTLNASGILPVSLGVPAAVLLLMGLSARRRRRRSPR
jgi:hypothetical protein